MRNHEILRCSRGVTLIGLALISGLMPSVFAQDESQEGTLGDLARKTRAEKTTEGHVSARKVLNEENATHSHLIAHTSEYHATIPPAKLTVWIPDSSRPAEHGSEVPLGKSTIYIPFGETVWNSDFNVAGQKYLSMLLTRSRFSGAALQLDGVEDTTVSEQRAVLVHFNFNFKGIPHKGSALFVSAPEQVMAVGCMYRKVDWEQAEPICEAVINSAEAKIPEQYRSFKEPYR